MPCLQAQLEEAKAKHAVAASEASDAKQSLADKELLLMAAAPANGDLGEDAVRHFLPATRVVLALSGGASSKAVLGEQHVTRA